MEGTLETCDQVFGRFIARRIPFNFAIKLRLKSFKACNVEEVSRNTPMQEAYDRNQKFSRASFTAILYGLPSHNRSDDFLLRMIQKLSERQVILVSENSQLPWIPKQWEKKIHVVFVGSTLNRWEVTRKGIEKALHISNETDLFILLSPDCNRSSIEKIGRTNFTRVDFASGKGWMLLSRRYAKYLLDSGNIPSKKDALKHGYSPFLSFWDLIFSPSEILRRNSVLIKFMTIGATGVVVNLGILALLKFFLFAFYSHSISSYLIANGIAVECSILNNFFWNDRFTFRSRLASLTKDGARNGWPLRLAKYNIVSMGSFATNMIAFTLLETLGIWYIWSSLMAILLSFAINYLGSTRWAWNKSAPISQLERQVNL